MTHETATATFRLADMVLTVHPKSIFADERSARAAVEPTLESWQAVADLEYSIGECRFEFDKSTLAYRESAGRGAISGVAYLTLDDCILVAEGVVTKPVRSKFPDPPEGFAMDANVQELLDRFRRSEKGEIPITFAAYYCLTVVEKIGEEARASANESPRLVAARICNIEIDVLKRLGALSSEHGGLQEGRKASSVRPLTQPERVWLRATMKALIRHFGNRAAGGIPPLLSIASLPACPP